ncbi:transcriptional regulator, RpiR family [Spongiibacter sp. IMCC21906]|uniref:SIS domain-containing protein n=1 Tax=Spongiibacter sp. IMCC21906 TaxID=1620392 RepID=UPI00062DCFEC|nr:SIS domain-containing protein [Spongiibacter sp. IMCC21906]AKH70819.1 transcriptional regulator, RpiR family [Spongiibacter sp. IMCC21906]
MRPRNIIRAIESARDGLRRSERLVADYILANRREVIHMRIVDLAQEAHVSEPTVVRFCRAVGCDGFQNFKLTLAQHIAHSPEYAAFSFTDDDSARQYTFTVFDATMEALKKVRDSIEVDAVEKAVDLLANARRVELYGFGASAAVASDAQHNFFRLQISASVYSDPHMQAMSAMSLHSDDVVVAISQSGRTRSLLDAIKLAQKSGATVIALAPSGSPVADASDLPIYIDVDLDEGNYTPLPSRLAHMTVLDILAVGIANTKKGLREHLATIEAGLQALRLDTRS